jgi:hypothetical protein
VNNLSKSKLDGKISMFAGMDLHKNYLQIAVMNDKGKVLENSRINNNLNQVGRFFDENINDEKVRVVMESSSVWYNTYSYLSEGLCRNHAFDRFSQSFLEALNTMDIEGI